ncbi:MAG: hypothetical protein ACI4N3_04585 [Alphaproteobacteria bacterium]
MKQKKVYNKKKIIFAIIFSAVLTSGINANVAVRNQNISKNDLKVYNLESIPSLDLKNYVKPIYDIKTEEIDYSQYSPSPYQIQGNFETGWKVENFWNPNDNGGVAVGPFQIHSDYMLKPFFEYLKNNAPSYFNKLNEKGGIKAIRANDVEMRKFFSNLCKDDENFVKLQATFIDKENFQPRLNALKSQYGLDISARSPSIEGIFRAMSANIGWKTNYVVKEMAKILSKEDSISDINSVTDEKFVEVLQESLHIVINNHIQPRFRKHLLTAYDATITKDVIPNLGKKVLSESAKKKVVKKRNNVNSINLSIKTKPIDIAFSKKTIIKKDDEVAEVPYNRQDSKYLPPKKDDVITVEKVIEKNKDKEYTPSLLRKAELILMKETLANATKELDKINANSQVAVKVAKTSKPTAKVLTVEDVIKKASSKRKRKDGYVTPDFSDLLKEAASHII